jgi:hypothetical protein
LKVYENRDVRRILGPKREAFKRMLEKTAE